LISATFCVTNSSVASFLLPSSLLVPEVEFIYTSPWNQALPSQSKVWALELALDAPLPTICAYLLEVSSILYLPCTC
jgi:hypothetical protein